MAMRVLVVDDSGFFRRRVTEMLNADPALEVVGTASDGQEAIEQTRQLRPDVITMDIEMPVLDGISATRRIMQTTPTPIIMFSSLTTDGAKATLDALDAGALDFLPKRFEDISSDREEARKQLCMRVREIARQPVKRLSNAGAPAAATPKPLPAAKPTAPAPQAPTAAPRASGNIKVVAIGTSTGGPVALQAVLTHIPADFPLPIVLVQHMPASFTPAFAQRLNSQCAIDIKEAAEGDVLQAGTAYLAPGGKQMIIEGSGDSARIHIHDAEANHTYKPSVDITFNSLNEVFPAKTLAIILTGMGADGREGARALKQRGSTVWAQDEASCVVYGMPAAVAEAGLTERVVPLAEIGPGIIQRI